jgi:chemotaxis signal transduction protein
MFHSRFQPKRLSHVNNDVNLLKVLVFEMADRFFALPLNVIFKVIECPPITNTVHRGIGMADFEQQTITVVNLAQRLSPQIMDLQTPKKRFLILTQTRQGQLCGIPIDKSPALIELPVENIHQLSSSYRQMNPLCIATHMAILPESEGSLKIFLLGMTDKLTRI